MLQYETADLHDLDAPSGSFIQWLIEMNTDRNQFIDALCTGWETAHLTI